MSMEDVLIGARRKLLADTAFAALIGTDVGRDIGGAYNDGWVFRSGDDVMTPDRNPRNTGTSSVVLSARDTWIGPNRNNTLRFPLLNVRILSDSTRGTDPTLLMAKDAEYRCGRVGTAIFNALNDVGNRSHVWPNGAWIVSCILWNDLKISDIPNEDGLVSGEMSFALEIG